MNTLSDYYSDTDCELLELVSYHQRYLSESEQSGVADPEKKQKIEMLGKFREEVNIRAKQRKVAEEDMKKENDNFMKDRMRADCPECETVKPVEILGEKKHSELGYMCDLVKCSACNSEFLNYMPNNWDDRIKFIDCIISGLLEVCDDRSTISEHINTKEEAVDMVEGFRKLKNAHLEVVKHQSVYNIASKNADKAIEEIRDYLLLAKVNIANWGNPPAFSS